ncbi:pyridoxamine 5'-phosphate oxidase [Sinimarinibacterium sp. CAU 1509]|uniref:pyridoxamine 5'-phosphate oxidase family protein n=1 Tax=Sinimarinibacterium sp. CAU 1509 TaxID=2562283 RepID=UPI0010ACC919|nr:pyridoxamine 5'-phosphate oxidase family protein [Sinimarinibacterium sp. CAU 1509]TJY62280.1 pyridoxamine 5'-phosphate oxidase [Sinimarinibacterium sp. CAU 1509]
MGRRFAEISFTDSVKAAQIRYGTRKANEGFESAPDRRDALTEREIHFIAERDSFYMASHGIGADGLAGWPYVQHRGGYAGFLRVLHARRLAFADYRGNRQYISTGNVMGDDRVSLFLMDYPKRQRLKIWARATVVNFADDPDLLASLENPDYKARIERAFVLDVEAVDWNCPQHITPRFSEFEVRAMIAPLHAEIEQLKAQLTMQQADSSGA